MTEETEPSPQQPRTWPPGRPPEPGDRIETRCPECGVAWWIHKRLAGHRLRCDCGAWVEVPAERHEALPAERQGGGLVPFETGDDAVGWGKSPDYSAVPSSSDPVREVGTGEAVAPNALRHATLRTRRRWINRGVLELLGVMIAFLGPELVLVWLAKGPALVYMPLSSLASGILVVGLGSAAPNLTFGGLKPTRARYFAEGALVALAAAGLAIGWVAICRNAGYGGGNLLQDLRGELGLLWTLVLVGVFPAVFEELAFRGLVQGRLAPVYGRNGAILITGVAFGLAHGVGLGFPFHIFGGLYLCWLRARSDSLFPGMIVHCFYNSTLVLAMSS